MKNNKSEFSVMGMPVHDVPQFEEVQGKDWISYGSDDCYGDYLESLYLGSSIHSAIVNGVGAMIYGKGLDAVERDDSEANKEQWLRLQTLLNTSDDDLLKKLALDLKLYGQCYVNTIWNKARTSVVQMKHLPVHTMRAGIADSDGKIHEWYYKSSWNRANDRVKPNVLKSFSIEDRTSASTVLQIKRYSPSFHYYGLPDSQGSNGYVELDIQVQSFHLNNIKNSLMPSMMLSFSNGIPTDQERSDIERKVYEKFSGSNNAGKLLITFNDGPETAPKIEPITSNGSDDMYTYLSGEITNKVLTGHRITSPLLFGVSGNSNWGSNADELNDSYSLFHNTVVEEFQDILLKGLSPVFTANSINLDLFFVPSKPANFINIDDDTTEVAEAPKEEMSTDVHETDETLLDALISLGEDEPEGYELIDSRKVDYDDEDRLDGMIHGVNLASAISVSGDKSNSQDNELFKIRYQYAPLKYDQMEYKSRSFCVKMVEAARYYTRENIIKAGGEGVNDGWGPDGSNKYSIWFYKGGGSCAHYWMRTTWLQKDNQKITAKQRQAIINEMDPDDRDPVRIKKNDSKVAKRPRDMRNRGFLPSNKAAQNIKTPVNYEKPKEDN
ncbi:MAG: putative portal protein [Prokaryotic dsDNA virus sp.]|nr:MAG: putative portal protein [Prokaryotic dsDNA virus sp.]|tara:strand:+ start:2604 stop:4433 length:1830 start_codon:yes stop_codon:yes gene_type:complete